MLEVTVKTVNADTTANNMMAVYCKYSKLLYWQVQLMVYINWHHTVNCLQLNTLKKCWKVW